MKRQRDKVYGEKLAECQSSSVVGKVDDLGLNEEPFARSNKRPKKKVEKPGFDRRMFHETTCYSVRGLRYVTPYYFTFTTHCKGRWVGKRLIDVFTQEFRMESPAYYEAAIRNGKITIDDCTVSPNEVLKQNQLIRTRIHRHEPPVNDCPIEFVTNDDSMVVINKPSSIPVHPCGRYRHNTVVFILGENYGLTNLHTIHRIDRLTSGILMFAKTVSKAQEMEACVKGRLVQKEYLCRVTGEFPKEPVMCSEPITVVSHKVGVCQAKPDGKEAETNFSLMNFNGHSSLVKCVPRTGRMHQIRVHLQYLGFPILNDPIYNRPDIWGPDNGKGGSNRDVKDLLAAFEESRKDAISKLKASKAQNTSSDALSNEYVRTNDTEANSKQILPEIYNTSPGLKANSYDPDCSECSNPIPDPIPSELVMYLHALSYKGPNWEFRTSLPEWATDDWQCE